MTDKSSDRDEIGVICVACGCETVKAIVWVRKHTQLECPGCGMIIDIESRNFRSTIRKEH